jgi:Tfp pilus assembly protein PilP
VQLHLHLQVLPTDEASLRLVWRVPCRVDAQPMPDHTDDPFRLSSWQSLHAARVQAPPRSMAPAARWSQPRTPLERFPLDQAHYVGRLFDAHQSIAIVQMRGPSSEVVHYSVKVGQAMGPNLGTVTRLDAQALEVQEWLRDASGEWRSRRVQLLWEGP